MPKRNLKRGSKQRTTKKDRIVALARDNHGPEEIVNLLHARGEKADLNYIYKTLSEARQEDPLVPGFKKRRNQEPDKPTRDDEENDQDTTATVTIKSKLDKLDLKTDHARVLRDTFKQTLGVPYTQASALLAEVDNRPDFFLDRPDELENTLRGMLSNQRASIVTHRWTAEMKPKVEAAYASTKKPDIIEQTIEDQLKLARVNALKPDILDSIIKLEQIRQMRDSTHGSDGSDPELKAILQKLAENKGDSEVKALLAKLVERNTEEKHEREVQRLEAKIDRMESEKRSPAQQQPESSMFDKAQEAYLVKEVFRDSNPGGAETILEYDPVLDENGKEVKDENGNTRMRPGRRVTRPFWQGGGGHAGPGGDSFDRMLEQMGKIMMLKTLSSINQGGGYGQGMMSPFMGQELEPIIDAEGKVVKDEYGAPVMKVRTIPMAAMGAAAKGGEDSMANMLKVVEIMADKGKGEDRTDVVNLLVERINSMSDKQFDLIQSELEAVKGSDPMEYTLGVMSKLKELGYIGDKGDNLEVAKMNIDLKRWQGEQENALTRWIHEQKMAFEDKKYARVQMQELGETIRKAVTEIGKPMAEGFKDGLAKGRAAANGNGNGGSKQHGAQHNNAREMTKDELESNLEQAEQAERVVADAKAQLIAEARRRGLLPQQSSE